MAVGEMNILRVFPRRTAMTPTDEDVRVGYPTLWDRPNLDRGIHISVAFTWDIPFAERLLKAWEPFGEVRIGGPAFNNPADDFVCGRYLKMGAVITSRGCPNRCWFCKVWKVNPTQAELPIQKGHIVNDDNLLACSDTHILKVFDMLKSQRKIEFVGGLEAARLKDWHIESLLRLSIHQMFFAYDTNDDLEPLIIAGVRLTRAGFNRNKLRCYTLISYPGDTFEKAETRLLQAWKAGFLPFAMLYCDDERGTNLEWRRFARLWMRPAATKKVALRLLR